MKSIIFLIRHSSLTCRVKLDKLHILTGQASSGHHGVSISGTSVGRCAAEIGSSITSGGIENTVVTKSELRRMNLLCNQSVSSIPGSNDCVLSSETVNRSILHAESNHSFTFSILHQKVQGKVLNKVSGVITKRLKTKQQTDKI